MAARTHARLMRSLVQQLHSRSTVVQLQAASVLRSFAVRQRPSAPQAALDAGAPPALAKLLAGGSLELQRTAACGLALIMTCRASVSCAATAADAVVDAAAVPSLLSLLQGSPTEVQSPSVALLVYICVRHAAVRAEVALSALPRWCGC